MKGDPIAASQTLKFIPWRAPNFATVAGKPGTTQAPSIPIAELDPDALDKLALAWLSDLYSKAGREVPGFLEAVDAETGR